MWLKMKVMSNLAKVKGSWACSDQKLIQNQICNEPKVSLVVLARVTSHDSKHTPCTLCTVSAIKPHDATEGFLTCLSSDMRLPYKWQCFNCALSFCSYRYGTVKLQKSDNIFLASFLICINFVYFKYIKHIIIWHFIFLFLTNGKIICTPSSYSKIILLNICHQKIFDFYSYLYS